MQAKRMNSREAHEKKSMGSSMFNDWTCYEFSEAAFLTVSSDNSHHAGKCTPASNRWLVKGTFHSFIP